jgi:hypothetical protein
MDTQLKFVKRPQLKEVKRRVAQREGFGSTRWASRWDRCDPACVAVAMSLREFTNYPSIKDQGFWSQDFDEVKRQLAAYYQSIANLDPSLSRACLHGLQRHLGHWQEYNHRSTFSKRGLVYSAQPQKSHA